MHLEAYMGTLGTKTLLSQSLKLLKVYETFHKLWVFKALPKLQGGLQGRWCEWEDRTTLAETVQHMGMYLSL